MIKKYFYYCCFLVFISVVNFSIGAKTSPVSELNSKDILIKKPASLDNIVKNSIVFLNKRKQKTIPSTEALVLIPKGLDINGSKSTFIEVDNPRLSFAKIVNKYFGNKFVLLFPFFHCKFDLFFLFFVPVLQNVFLFSLFQA